MATQLVWARIKSNVVVGGRELQAGNVTELTPDEFRQLARIGACVPCGERGRAMTGPPYLVQEMRIRK